MEGERVKALLVTVLILGAFVGQSTAGFGKCYAGCFLKCAILSGPVICGVTCIAKCVGHGSAPNVYANHGFCKLGCASSLCTNISTVENPNEEKVESCVDSCSDKCVKNYIY